PARRSRFPAERFQGMGRMAIMYSSAMKLRQLSAYGAARSEWISRSQAHMTGQGRAAQRRVLVIDDNPAIHADVRKVLAPQQAVSRELAAEEAILFGDSNCARPHAIQNLEFQIDTASQGEEGIELARRALEERQPYAIAFVDGRMPPGLDGIE